MASNKVENCISDLQEKIAELCEAAGIPERVYAAYRTERAQQWLRGKLKP